MDYFGNSLFESIEDFITNQLDIDYDEDFCDDYESESEFDESEMLTDQEIEDLINAGKEFIFENNKFDNIEVDISETYIYDQLDEDEKEYIEEKEKERSQQLFNNRVLIESKDKKNLFLKDYTSGLSPLAIKIDKPYNGLKEIEDCSDLKDKKMSNFELEEKINQLISKVNVCNFRVAEFDSNNGIKEKKIKKFLNLNLTEELIRFSEDLISHASDHFRTFSSKVNFDKYNKRFGDRNKYLNFLRRFNHTKIKFDEEIVNKIKIVYIPSAGGKSTFIKNIKDENFKKRFRDVDDVINDNYQHYQIVYNLCKEVNDFSLMNRWFKFIFSLDVKMNYKNFDVYLVNHPNQLPRGLKFCNNELIIIPKELRFGDKFFTENLFNLLGVKHKITIFSDYDDYFKYIKLFLMDNIQFRKIIFKENNYLINYRRYKV